ncbi:MAG: TonB-dependent receptor [Muribaculaceae bacterium]|nr:TonB-dependent receptor [Muribaculaceae bacterium]
MSVIRLLHILLIINVIATPIAYAGEAGVGSLSPDSTATSLREISLGEVSVSAIKGGNNPQADEAVTYIGRKAIETYDLINLREASAFAPNFYIPAYGSRMTSSIYVRGLGTRIDQPVVGLNIDNIPIINKDNYDVDLADIDRIELLRGPQNILYGRNTMGGLVNIYTLSPLNYEGVRARLSYGNHNTWRASAGIYRRLTGTLGMSLTGELSGTDGFHRNLYNNSNAGSESYGSLRWKTAFRPSSKVVVENTAMLTRGRQHGYPYLDVAAGKIAYNDTCYYSRLSFIDGLTVKHSFKGITFSSIMSVQYLDDDMTLDQDFTTYDYFTLTQKRKEWAVTGDFVARGPKTGKYSWLTGVFGYYRHSDMQAPVTFYSTGIDRLIVANRNNANPYYPIAWDSPSFTLGSDFTMPSGGLSAYHESSLTLGDFTITAGLRLDWERTDLRYRSHCNTGYTVYHNADPSMPQTTPLPVYRNARVEIDESGSLSHDYTQLLPKLSLSYNLPEMTGNVYASATKGYKAGGYNTQMFSDFLQQRLMADMGLSMQYDVDQTVAYSPETDWTFEIGAHLWFLDQRLNVDFSAFWINIEDQQITMFPEGTITGRIMANAGRARSRGIELAASYQAPGGWFAKGSYGFTDARFLDFNNGRADYSGKRIPYAPSNTLFIGAGYTRHLTGFVDSATLQVNTRGVGNICWDETNSAIQPFYMLLNASVAATHRNFRLEIWADNITATQYATFYFVSIGNTFLQRGNGFSIGVTLTWQMEM